MQVNFLALDGAPQPLGEVVVKQIFDRYAKIILYGGKNKPPD
jgi:hypothetical protein